MRSETRRTRESLTRALSRIASRIAEQPTRTMEWNNPRTYSRDHATVTAKRLWVAGSYARGAPECGDLDLILEIEFRGAFPPDRTIASALFGRAPDVSLYIGTPEENSSYVAFPEARLVWSEGDPDWNAAIAGIPEDPGATRFSRPTDRLPLRPDQLDGDKEELGRLVELADAGILAWEFVDASEIREDDAAFRNTRLHRRAYGAKTEDALRMAVSHLGWSTLKRDWEPEGTDGRTRFRFEGTLLLVGHPAVPVEVLDAPFHDRLAIVPHRSRRGPNGIWLISRGPEHPLEKWFADCRAFYVTRDGEPIFFVDSSHRNATGLELFRSEEDALDHAQFEREFDLDDDDEETDESVAVASAAGSDLLKRIAGCDMVFVDGVGFPLSQVGQLAVGSGKMDGVPIADAPSLVSALQVASSER